MDSAATRSDERRGARARPLDRPSKCCHFVPTHLSSVPWRPAPKRSAVEIIKENSRHLRGTLAQELAADSEKFNDQDKQLIKFHGSYQQDNRDARKDRKEGRNLKSE